MLTEKSQKQVRKKLVVFPNYCKIGENFLIGRAWEATIFLRLPNFKNFSFAESGEVSCYPVKKKESSQDQVFPTANQL